MMENKKAFRKELLDNLKRHGIPRIELKYIPKGPVKCPPNITSPWVSSEYFRQTWNPDTISLFEEFKVMLLKSGSTLIGISTIAMGEKRSVHLTTNFIIALAILSNTDLIILAHNHPSGEPSPSVADKQLTEKIYKICAQFDILLLDQVIITKTSYYSFCQHGHFPLSQATIEKYLK